MARGYLSGVIVGTIVSGLGLGTVSVLTSTQQGGAPQAASLDVPAGSEFNQSLDDTAAALPGAEDTPEPGQAPEVSAPEPDDLASLQEADTQPAAQPETGQAEDAMQAPDTGEGASGVTVDSEAPVLPSPQSQAPEVPQGEDDLSISTDPAQPAMPDVGGDDAAFPAPESPAEAEDDTADVPAEIPAEEPSEDIAEDIAEETAPEPDSTIGDLAPEVKTNRCRRLGMKPNLRLKP